MQIILLFFSVYTSFYFFTQVIEKTNKESKANNIAFLIMSVLLLATIIKNFF